MNRLSMNKSIIGNMKLILDTMVSWINLTTLL